MSNGHPIIKIDGRNFIVDTGSPISFFTREEGNIIISEELLYLNNNPLGISLESVEKLVGDRIDGFIGLDVLRKLSCITFDKGANTVSFSVLDKDTAKAVIPLYKQFFTIIFFDNKKHI